MCAFFEKHMTGSTVVERRSVTGELFLSYARPAADGWQLMWANRPLQCQPTWPTQPFILSRSINSSELQSDVCYLARVAPSGECLRSKGGAEFYYWCCMYWLGLAFLFLFYCALSWFYWLCVLFSLSPFIFFIVYYCTILMIIIIIKAGWFIPVVDKRVGGW